MVSFRSSRTATHYQPNQTLRAVFFDRDGTLNVDRGYVHRTEDFEWLPTVRETILALNNRDILVFVVTNQSGVARGYYDERAVQALHRWMNNDLRGLGAHIDDFRYCPHHPQGLITEYSVDCQCRKPSPGMITDLLDSWSLDPRQTVLVGDRATDLLAGQAAHVRSLQVKDGLLLSSLVAPLLSDGLPDALL